MKKELYDRDFKIRFTKSVWNQIEEFAAATGRDVSTVIRRGVDKELQSESTGENLTLRLSHGAPCGEWRDTSEDATDFEISAQLVQLWAVQPTDELLATQGASMLGASIPEKAILLMRPFIIGGPSNGDICAVIATMKNGDVLGTVKKWEWGSKGAELKDGDNKKFGLPDGAVRVDALSKWTGHLLTY